MKIAIIIFIILCVAYVVYVEATKEPVVLELDKNHCPEWMAPAFSLDDDNVEWEEWQGWMEDHFDKHDKVVFHGPVSERFKKVAKQAAKNTRVKLDI